jgi:hypothetical protein
MHSDLVGLISRSLDEARERGRDYLGQGEHAVSLVMRVRPDLTASEAAKAVDAIRLA